MAVLSSSADEGAPPITRTPSEYVEKELGRYRITDCFQLSYTLMFCLMWFVCGQQVMVTVLVMLPAERVACSTSSNGERHCIPIDESDCSWPKEVTEFVNKEETLVAEFAMVCEDAYKVAFVGTSFWIGFIFATSFFGPLADARGRRLACFAAIVILQFAAVLCVFAPSFEGYTLGRCLLGIGVGGVELAAYVWHNEILGGRSRSFLSGGVWGVFCLGILSLPLLGSYLPAWRSLQGAIALVALPCAGAIFLQESPKWLAAVGQNVAANGIIESMASRNGASPPSPPVGLMSEEREELQKQQGGKSVSECTQPAAPKPSQNRSGLGDLFCDPRLARRFWIKFIVWFTLSMSYYGLNLSVGNLGSNVYLTMFFGAIAELPGYALTAPCVNSVMGRRGTTMGGLVLSGLCLLLAASLRKDPAPGESSNTSLLSVMNVLVLVGKFPTALAFTVVYLYGSELFPTDCRSRAMGLLSLSSRVGAIVAAILAGVGRHSLVLSLVLFGLANIVSGFLLVGLPETRGLTVPDFIDDIEPPAPLLKFRGKRQSSPDPLQTRLLEG